MKKLYFLLIGILALTGCTKSSGKKIGENGLEYTLSESKDSYIVTGIGTCKETDIVIPSTFKNLPVTGIDDYAFFYCDSLTSIEIPSTLTRIGRAAFFYCDSLTSVEIPNSVTSIGETAFFMCTSLNSIVIPSSVTSIGESAFYNHSLAIYCEASSKPSGWEEHWNFIDLVDDSLNKPVYWGINKNDIIYQDDLQFLIIDENAVVTGYKENITNVDIPSKITVDGTQYDVTSIGESAFKACSSLASISIPTSVTNIGKNAFFYCSSLTSVSVEENSKLVSIGESAFSECSSLASITIPNSVTSVGSDSFYNCESLTIYCEATSKPSGWHLFWNFSERPVYWAEQWSYVNAVPVPNN